MEKLGVLGPGFEARVEPLRRVAMMAAADQTLALASRMARKIIHSIPTSDESAVSAAPGAPRSSGLSLANSDGDLKPTRDEDESAALITQRESLRSLKTDPAMLRFFTLETALNPEKPAAGEILYGEDGKTIRYGHLAPWPKLNARRRLSAPLLVLASYWAAPKLFSRRTVVFPNIGGAYVTGMTPNQSSEAPTMMMSIVGEGTHGGFVVAADLNKFEELLARFGVTARIIEGKRLNGRQLYTVDREIAPTPL
jgi:hypothetical protein